MKRQQGLALPDFALYGVIALALVAALSGIGYGIYNAGEKGAELQCMKDAEAERKRKAENANKASDNKEKGDAKAKVVYRTITQNVDRYIDRPIYRNVCFDDDGLLDANAALVGGVASKPDKSGTKPDAAK